MKEHDSEAHSQEHTDIPSSVLAHLRCPKTRLELLPMDIESLIELNGRVALEQVFTVEGQLVERPLTYALVTRNNARAYPVENGIPVLVQSAAIKLTADE